MFGVIFFLCSILPFNVVLNEQDSVHVYLDAISSDVFDSIIEYYDRPIIVHLTQEYYYLSSPIRLNSPAKQKVIIQGENNTHIVGFRRLEGWSQTADGLWKCKIPATFLPFSQLYINGSPAVLARTPNSGTLRIKSVLSTSVGGEYLYKIWLDSYEDELEGVTESEESIVTVFRKWTFSRHYLLDADDEEGHISYKGMEYPSYNPLSDDNTIVLSNYRSALDEPGEWMYDSDGYVYYYPHSEDCLEESVFLCPQIDKLIEINGTKDSLVSNIEFDSIIFEGTGIALTELGLEPGQASSALSAAIEADNCNGIVFRNCEIRNTANYGIWFREHCMNCIIEDNYLHDLGAGAVKIGTSKQPSTIDSLTSNIRVVNNIINGYGLVMPNSVGVLVLNASNNNILHNDISHGGYSAISVGWTWGFGFSPTINNEISFNHIWRIGQGPLNDLGGIYTLGDATGTRVQNNYIHDVYSENHKAWGIYADEGTSNIIIENNLITRCTSGGIHQHYGSNNTVRNNILAFSNESQFMMTSNKGEFPLVFENNVVIADNTPLFSGPAVNSNCVVFRNNCFWDISGDSIPFYGTSIASWVESNAPSSLVVDPLFIDPLKDDFRFLSLDICNRIGFVPFDYKSSGVYGDDDWITLSKKEL